MLHLFFSGSVESMQCIIFYFNVSIRFTFVISLLVSYAASSDVGWSDLEVLVVCASGVRRSSWEIISRQSIIYPFFQKIICNK